jgi:cell division protein FtsL
LARNELFYQSQLLEKDRELHQKEKEIQFVDQEMHQLKREVRELGDGNGEMM